MAPYSSTLAWKIPWTEEPGGLQSVGSRRVYTTEQLHFHFSLSCIGEGNGNPLQCSCLENPRDGEAWWAAAYGVAQSQTRLKWLSSSSSRRGKVEAVTDFILLGSKISEDSDCSHEIKRCLLLGRKDMTNLKRFDDWRIPWREEPGRLQSMGLQRVGHNWATSLSLCIALLWDLSQKEHLPAEKAKNEKLVGYKAGSGKWEEIVCPCCSLFPINNYWITDYFLH